MNLIQSRQIQTEQTFHPSKIADRTSRKDRNRKKFALPETILNARRQRQLMQQSILNHFIARRRLILKVCAFALLLLSFHESKTDVS